MKSSFLLKYEQNFFKISALSIQGRNPYNYLLVFWEKRGLHRFILKLSELYLLSHSFLVNSKKIINRKYSPILETIAQHENYLKHVVSTRCQCWCILFRVRWVVEFISREHKLDFIKQIYAIQRNYCIM